jgi:hypothetical protein
MPVHDLVARLVDLEADVSYNALAAPGESEFRHVPGRVPVLISAPHGAAHTRLGQAKDEDEYTAGLARLVAELTGAHVFYARRRSLTDPNWDAGAPYKLRLAEIVRLTRIDFILDLHGAADRRPFGLALGTLSGRSCAGQLPAIIRALERSGFSRDGQGMARLDVDGAFTANGKTGQETVTRFAWSTLGVPAAQLEINESLRGAGLPSGAPADTLPGLAAKDALARTVDALVAFVHAVAGKE